MDVKAAVMRLYSEVTGMTLLKLYGSFVFVLAIPALLPNCLVGWLHHLKITSRKISQEVVNSVKLPSGNTRVLWNLFLFTLEPSESNQFSRVNCYLPSFYLHSLVPLVLLIMSQS